MYSSGFLEWYSEEAKRTYGDVLPVHVPNKRALVIKQPCGVAGMITPVCEIAVNFWCSTSHIIVYKSICKFNEQLWKKKRSLKSEFFILYKLV